MLFYTNVSTSYDNIQVTGVHDGVRFVKGSVKNFRPKLYTPQRGGKFEALDGALLQEHEFERVSQYRKFLKESKDIDNLKIYGEIQPEYQFISHFFGGDIKYDKKYINIAPYDIEVSSLDSNDRYVGFPHADIAPIPIVSIGLHHSIHNEMVVFGIREYDVSKTNHHKCPVKYIRCKNEYDLLWKFAKHITSDKYRVDILFAWNGQNFDLPYIINRSNIVGGSNLVKALSPFGQVHSFQSRKKQFGRFVDFTNYEIKGITHIDAIDAYITYSGQKTQQSYALDFIAQEELGYGKMDYGEARNIMEFFWADHQNYINYNIRDVWILKEIIEKRGLVDRILAMAYTNKCNYIDTLGTTRQWDTRLYNRILKDKKITLYKKEREKQSYAGGYVRDSKIGVQEWVVTVDFEGLYPAIARTWNMSPETYLEKPNDDCCKTPNGRYFTRKFHGLMPRELGYVKRERDRFKELRKMYEKTDRELYNLYDTDQYVQKILQNSWYGSMGNRFFRFYRPEIAEAITLTGQYCIKKIAETLNEGMNEISETSNLEYIEVNFSGNETGLDNNQEDYLVMGDTDSCAVSFDNFINKRHKNLNDKEKIDKILSVYDEIIKPKVDKCIENINKEFNVYESCLNLQLESIAKKAIYLVKKHYIGHIVYEEGNYFADKNMDYYPYLKVKGVEGVKSSTSSFFRNHLKEFYKITMIGTKKDVLKFVRDVRKEYISLPLEYLGKPIKINQLKKWQPINSNEIYIKGTHENAKAALIYNHYLEKMGLQSKYNMIKEGDSVTLLKLKLPNLLGEKVVAIPDGHLPEEFGLKNNINYMEQFEKYFMKPVSNILELLKWSLTQKKGLL